MEQNRTGTTYCSARVSNGLCELRDLRCRVDDGRAEHIAILAALEARDAEVSKVELISHFHNIGEYVFARGGGQEPVIRARYTSAVHPAPHHARYDSRPHRRPDAVRSRCPVHAVAGERQRMHPDSSPHRYMM